jgi:hypothetical protein
MGDWKREQAMGDLWDIIDAVSGVGELEIARLKDMCEAHGIKSDRFVDRWVDLVDASHEIIDAAEEKLF